MSWVERARLAFDHLVRWATRADLVDRATGAERQVDRQREQIMALDRKVNELVLERNQLEHARVALDAHVKQLRQNQRRLELDYQEVTGAYVREQARREALARLRPELLGGHCHPAPRCSAHVDCERVDNHGGDCRPTS